VEELCAPLPSQQKQGKELPHARFGGQVKAVPARVECVFWRIRLQTPEALYA
jgi:hypothetical protein